MKLPANGLMIGAIALLSLALAFFGYAFNEYANAECHAGLRQAGLHKDYAELYAALDDTVSSLRTGTGAYSKWENPHFQADVDKAAEIVAHGRQALRKQRGATAVGDIDKIEEILSRLKRVATTRVNDILKKQDPADPDAFEKYRLEGRNLVEIVREIDGGLERLMRRPRKLPGLCSW